MELSYTKELIEAGVDEVGRGPIAGPVVAAAVILPHDFREPRLRDSKKLSEKLRLELEVIIKASALAYSVVEISHEEIDRINILQATYRAMNQAIGELGVTPELLLIDGNRFKSCHPIEYHCIVGGDDKYLSIAAASVLAKCHRDRLMGELGAKFPAYKWEKNMGYPTKDHIAAVERYGITEHHRLSFSIKGVKLGELIKVPQSLELPLVYSNKEKSMIELPKSWNILLEDELQKPYFKELIRFTQDAYNTTTVYPPQKRIFRAFECCKPEDVRVVIIGQDPYHGENQANGLCFSVPQSQTKLPPSLKNILKEIEACGYKSTVEGGDLEVWARQGVLLLNAVLTVEAHKAASHSKRGWERFTDAVIQKLATQREGVVYMLWGSYAEKKCALVDESRNLVLRSCHPSPLSAYKGWFGSAHFAKANEYLSQRGESEIVW